MYGKDIPQDDIDCKLTTDWRNKTYPSETDVYYVHGPVRIFLAGPWFWPEAEQCMKQAFEKLNADPRFEVWCAMVHGKLDMKEYARLKALHVAEFEGMSPCRLGCDFEVEWDRKKEEAFQRDVEHIFWCDMLVGMIECWDSGTMFEIGGVRILEKPCFAFSYEPNRECNLMLERAIVGFTTNIEEIVPMIEHKVLRIAKDVAYAPTSSLTTSRYLGRI